MDAAELEQLCPGIVAYGDVVDTLEFEFSYAGSK
jgi:hypothetical protein